MTPQIYDIFSSNLERYKNKYKANKKYYEDKGEHQTLTRAEKNDYIVLFHIIFYMHRAYGCPECKRKSCDCGVLPFKHPCIPKHLCAGDPPWGYNKLCERERIRIVFKEKIR